MNRPLGLLIKFIVRASGRTQQELCESLGISFSTLKRYQRDARELGIRYELRRDAEGRKVYRMLDYGPLNIHKLRALTVRRRAW